MHVSSIEGKANWAQGLVERRYIANLYDRVVVVKVHNEALGVNEFSSTAALALSPNAKVGANNSADKTKKISDNTYIYTYIYIYFAYTYTDVCTHIYVYMFVMFPN